MRNVLNRNKISIGLKKHFTAPRLVLLGFFCVVIFGGLLLMTPAANADGNTLNFTDALFTAVSATCVTGLATSITATQFSTFGHIIILVLIQIGGLGIMTISSAFYLLIGKKFTLYNRMTLKDEYSDFTIQEFKKIVKKLVIVVFFVEAFGAVLLSIAFSRYFSAGRSIWYGIFHSVSAFCNAGFDIFNTAGTSVEWFNSDPFVLLTLAALIIVGGLGFIVIIDVIKNGGKWRKISLQAKIVLPMTLILLLAGSGLYLGAEWNNPATIGNMSVGDKILNAFFQSTTTRTAGYASISQSAMSSSSTPVSMVLMFIGASPGSTGGGLKTTTLFILLASVVATVKKKKSVIIDMHKIGAMAIKKAASMLMLSIIVQTISFIAITFTDGITFTNTQLLFEVISAYATVGLSMDVSVGLSIAGKYIIMANMFLGRVGSFTFFMAFSSSNNLREPKIKYPEANINM